MLALFLFLAWKADNEREAEERAIAQAAAEERQARILQLQEALTAGDADRIRGELPWFRARRENTELASWIDVAEDFLDLRARESELRDLQEHAEEVSARDEERASEILEGVLLRCLDEPSLEPCDAERIARQLVVWAPYHVRARQVLGEELVENAETWWAQYLPFFDLVDGERLVELSRPHWVPAAQAREEREELSGYIARIEQLRTRYTQDPRFEAGLDQLTRLRGHPRMELDSTRGIFEDGIFVFLDGTTRRALQSHLAEMHLEAVRHARQFFEETHRYLPGDRERLSLPIIVVSMRDRERFQQYVRATMGTYLHDTRAYYIPTDEFIVTYNHELFDPDKRDELVRDIVTTTIHEATHNLRHQLADEGERLRGGLSFEEGWAEFAAAVNVDFDPTRAEILRIERGEAHTRHFAGYIKARHSYAVDPLSLRELIRLHSRNEEQLIASLQSRMQRLGRPVTERSVQATYAEMMQLCYAQGYSFIRYCNSQPELASRFAQWHAWQWSAGACEATSDDAWRKFKSIFEDPAALEKNWHAWEMREGD